MIRMSVEEDAGVKCETCERLKVVLGADANQTHRRLRTGLTSSKPTRYI